MRKKRKRSPRIKRASWAGAVFLGGLLCLGGCKKARPSEGIKSPDVPHEVMADFNRYIHAHGDERFQDWMLMRGFQAIEINGQMRWADKYGEEIPPEFIQRSYNDFLRIELEKFARDHPKKRQKAGKNKNPPS